MKEFVKDYVDLCKESGKFYKKHWKGVILLNVLIIGAEMAYYQYKYDMFDLNFGKKSKEEEEAR